MNTINSFALLSGLWGTAWLAVVYRSMAFQNGWKIGALFADETNWVLGVSMASFISCLILGFVNLAWWQVLLIPVAGIVISFVLVYTFKSWAQLMSFSQVPLFIVAWWFMGVS